MSANQSPKAAARIRRVCAPWRLALVLYAFALVIATHWPNLRLGPEVPASDKMIHLTAFGTLTILLWKTRWLKHAWALGAIVLAWAAADEYTQGIPGLNRTVSIYDLLANGMGILLAVAWIWALRPVGAPVGVNRMRLKLNAFVLDDMFAMWRPWRAMVIGALAGGIPLLMIWFFVDAPTKRAAIILAMLIAGLITLLLWTRGWRSQLESIVKARPCLDCGRPDVGASDRATARLCAGCGAAITPTQWAAPPAPVLRTLVRLGMRSAITGAAILIAGFAFILATPLIYSILLSSGGASGRAGWIAPRLVRLVGTMPPELTNALDFAALFILLALVVRLYRQGLARFYDRGLKCMNCGHDLRGTPVDSNRIGRCGECGAAFVRTT